MSAVKTPDRGASFYKRISNTDLVNPFSGEGYLGGHTAVSQHEDPLDFFLRTKDFQRVIELANQKLTENPADEKAFYYRTTAFLELKDYDACLKSLDPWLQKNPDDFRALTAKAICFDQTGQAPEAEEAFLEAFKTNTDNQTALGNLVNFYRSQNRPEEALKFCEDLVSISTNPIDVISAYSLKLNTLQEMGQSTGSMLKEFGQLKIEGIDGALAEFKRRMEELNDPHSVQAVDTLEQLRQARVGGGRMFEDASIGPQDNRPSVDFSARP